MDDGPSRKVPSHVGQTLDACIFERVVQRFLGGELVATDPRAGARGEWSRRN